MAVFIGVSVVSAAGWIMSLLFSSSAARRHLVLLTALSACLLLPIAWGVRSGTNWTLLVICSPVNGTEMLAHDGMPWLMEPPNQRRLSPSEQADAGTPTPDAGLTPGMEETGKNDQSPTLHRHAAVESNADLSPAGSPTTQRSVNDGSATASTWVSIGHWAPRLYIFVAGAMLVRLLASLVALHRVRRRAVEVEALPSDTRVLEADVACPMAIGFGKPTIVLPRGFRGAVRPDELRDVLTHESEHLRRGDHWVILLQAGMAAVYWPIVTVHLLNRALVRAREELCDNAVLARRDPAAYGQTLLTVARLAGSRRSYVARLAPSVLMRGELERRVASLLDRRRDRRTQVNRWVSWTATAGLLGVAVLVGTTRTAVVAQQTLTGESEMAEPKAIGTLAPKNSIDWTGIPRVDLENATRHRGVVLRPDGRPLAGASIYAASTIELLELADAEEIGVGDLGPVRAVTDSKCRFEFDAQDLSWVTPAGERKRWETLLVATKEGIAPGWLKTWGEDRSFRSHWHPSKSQEVTVRTRPPVPLTGQLLLEGGTPLAGALVRLTALMAPREYDLEKHISTEEAKPLTFGSTITYAETLYRPWILPGLKSEATTDDEGRFELPELPEGFIAHIEVTHREAVTTSLHVAMRPIEPVYRKPFLDTGEPTRTLIGSGFSVELPPGAVLRGRVEFDGFHSNRGGVSGVIVARANHNAKDGIAGQRFQTDAEGRFEVTGLPDYTQGYELAFVGSFAAPTGSRRQRIVPGDEARVKLPPAAPYRLRLIDEQGNPIDREVYSVEVQQTPGSTRRGVKWRFHDAVHVAPGIYQGIVPVGPGAVIVQRGATTDRPVAVDPKTFFEPGRIDWTREEALYAYGDAWRIAHPSVITTELLAVGLNPTVDQLELAAVVFTNARAEDGVLELSATVESDPPVIVTLVDEAGVPVAGATVERQMKRYNGNNLPATFSVHGLHPERAEFLEFQHEQRGLIGTLSTTWTDEPVRVVMQPAAWLFGRFTNAEGKPNFDFGVRVLGERVMPGTFVAGRMYQTTDELGKRPGEFRLLVQPGAEVRGEFVRKTPDQESRPSAGVAFGPLTPQPGEAVDLGDLTAP